MGDPVKSLVENGLIQLFDFRGQNIDVAYFGRMMKNEIKPM